MMDFVELIEQYQASSTGDPDWFLEMQVESSLVRHIKAVIPIDESHEPLVPIPMSLARRSPHPYQALGAPYGEQGPWCVRISVAERLNHAQQILTRLHPGYRLEVFDAWRPMTVQSFMVSHECHRLASEQGDIWDTLDTTGQQNIEQQVLRYWAAPVANPLAPTPHSTGGAVDVTLLDENGDPLAMGSDIDEIGPQAHPHFFTNKTDADSRCFDRHRDLLAQVMIEAGFCRLPWEWWHFSYGDQMWALQQSLVTSRTPAFYGAVSGDGVSSVIGSKM